MPKNTGPQLFTKTWPLRREKKGRESGKRERPLTATLEKPTILDIRFIGKIDMSLVRKEFLNISNLCRLPLVIKKNVNRPLSLLSADAYGKIKKRKKKPGLSDDSHEDDESSVIQSAKTNSRSKSSRTKSVINSLKQSNILAVKTKDANNNKTLKVKTSSTKRAMDMKQEIALKVPSRKPTLTTIPAAIAPLSCPDLVKSSTKLPSPCRTCGRPDLPERFHSHPATPMSSSSPKKGARRAGLLGDQQGKTEPIPVKSTVQKPLPIKYKSKNGSAPSSDLRKMSPIKKSAISVTVSAGNSEKSTAGTKGRQIVTPLRGGSGKKTLTCHICGREFGTASLPLHQPKCLQKWERENASLPPHLRRKSPVMPEGNLSSQEWNHLAWETSQASLVPCPNCGRTFFPDRLEVHQRSCKIQSNNNKKTSSNDTLFSSSSMSQNSNPPTSASGKSQPPSTECYICGKMFGTHSIKIHERQCLKKWHVENESLPHDMRSPAPLKQIKNPQSSPEDRSEERSSATPSPTSSKDERPTSGTRSPLFPCYLCGKLFTVNSIYIHEPQCLKIWKIENDKLPLSKRRPVPLKPDVKFTHSGKLNFSETSEAYWQSHLSQLVPCKVCSRTFNPDRVAIHERSCKGN